MCSIVYTESYLKGVVYRELFKGVVMLLLVCLAVYTESYSRDGWVMLPLMCHGVHEESWGGGDCCCRCVLLYK